MHAMEFMTYVATGTTTGLSDVASTVIDIASSVLAMITGNTLLLTFFGAGIVGIAIGVVRKLKK